MLRSIGIPVSRSRRTILFLLLTCVSAFCFPGGWQEGGSLTFPGMLGVELQAGSMNVELLPADGDSIAFKAEGLKTGDRVLHEIGDFVLRLQLDRMEEIGYGENPGTAFLELPPGMIVRIFTTTGNVSGKNILGDNLFISSREGIIRLSGYDSPLDIRSATGSITIEDSGGAKRLSSTLGDITVLDSDGSLEASTASGAFRFERIRGRVYLHGGTGNVAVNSIRGGLRVYTSTGTITCSGIFLTDDSDFRSNAGNITVEFLNPASELAFELSTTTGRITLGDRTVTGSMILNNRTDINVTGRSSTGNQTYSFGSPASVRSSGFNPLEPAGGL